MATHLTGITVDCLEPERLGRFWAALLDRPVAEPGLPGWVRLAADGGTGAVINFQPVAEPKAGKTRIHLDVAVDDVTAGIAAVEALGGSATGERHDYDEGVVVVMADPEGNEFCLVQYYAQA